MACTNRITASLYRSHVRLGLYVNRVVDMAESIFVAEDFEENYRTMVSTHYFGNSVETALLR